MRRPFIQGLELSERLYQQAVRPLLAAHFPNWVYSAALLGQGSDVLGFNTPQSADHDWGPKLMLFLAEADDQPYRDQIDQLLRQELPADIRGYPTNFDRHQDGSLRMEAVESGPVNHAVQLFTVRLLPSGSER